MRPLSLATYALALCTALGAAAQKVYRCGPDGRIYQQTPCADGASLDASDPRSAEQRQAAQAVAKSEAKAAAQFDRSMTPASAPAGRKARPEAAPSPKDKAASSAKPASRKDDAPAKPMVFLVPRPKVAASAGKP